MRPPAITWPLGVLFWIAFVWAFFPEARILREARRAHRATGAAERDPSYRPLIVGQRIVMAVAFIVAVTMPRLAIRTHRLAVYLVGVGVLVAASLLRRHCFRMLGGDFRGAVTVRPDQPVVDRGAYRWLRHPSYAAAIGLHVGTALALAHWGSLAIVLLGTVPLFLYRIHVEERTLLARIGEPYRAYAARTSRLLPGVW